MVSKHENIYRRPLLKCFFYTVSFGHVYVLNSHIITPNESGYDNRFSFTEDDKTGSTVVGQTSVRDLEVSKAAFIMATKKKLSFSIRLGSVIFFVFSLIELISKASSRRGLVITLDYFGIDPEDKEKREVYAYARRVADK